MSSSDKAVLLISKQMKKPLVYLRELPAMFDVRGSKVITMTSSLAQNMA